ncbi:MAG: tetratricopeptide repeat protein [Calditrichaeota bacterium]|nr:tetratricopeptide repeat protein [Calditrichota bacterium]RQW07453.1 MAG: tetratricopeptide repeat protein [Calditrichota bacterium]
MNHKCPKCGAELTKNVKFCPECGTAQKSRTKSRETHNRSKRDKKSSRFLSGMNVIYLVILLSLIVVGIYGFRFVKPVKTENPHAGMPGPQQQEPAAISDPQHLQHLRENLEANPDGFRENVEMANFLYDNQRFHEAIPYYIKALEINPRDPNVIVDTGVSYFNIQDYEEAKKYFERALAIDANHVNALYNSGIVSAQLGQMSEMVRYWEQLITVAPNSNQAQNARQIMDQVRDNL